MTSLHQLPASSERDGDRPDADRHMTEDALRLKLLNLTWLAVHNVLAGRDLREGLPGVHALPETR